MLRTLPRLTRPLLRQSPPSALVAAVRRRHFHIPSNAPGSQAPTADWLTRPADPMWTFLAESAAAPNHKDKPETPEEIWASREKRVVPYLPRPHNAYSGRSVAVMRGDVSAAISKLRSLVTVNAVRITNIRDERHEKKGDKRSRLRSQRHRKRFAHEVRKRVQLVNEIRARGA